MMLMTILGRFNDVLTLFESLGDWKFDKDAALARSFSYIATAFTGDTEKAVALGTRAIEEATEDLDVQGVRAYGAALMLIHFMQGNLSEVDRVIHRVYLLGPPPPIPAAVYGIVLTVSARLAFRRGDMALVAYHSTLKSALFPVGQFTLWPRVQALLAEDSRPEAALLLWENGDMLWKRGARVAAGFSLLVSLEIQFDEERFRIAEERMGHIDGPIFESFLAYAKALGTNDPDGLVEVSDSAILSGRYGLALNALRSAAFLYVERREISAVSDVERREQALIDQLAPREVEGSRSTVRHVPLSERESEIVKLAAQGLGNQSIASELTISVRTVESHMFNALKKLGLTNRQSLRYYSGIL
jgi:DNA-binding CsgD family transcriptional regulator